ncbi:hypothetical protein [Salipiger abyssi]|uniref:Uncharacterized protein n=1 Tax=Salipiger abyssi TaxID=1250539 RepID=A0A1P8UWK4_9RHOB|nr:hypothetical protein [Salipiger abyssi]APZ53772.1 hypothetical protein Ga0080574_TMP3438 [Salipiger abyssi]
MAYQNDQTHASNPYAAHLRADPQTRMPSGRSGGTVVGLVVAVAVIVALIVGVGVLGGGAPTDGPAAPAAIEQSTPEAGAPVLGDETAPATPSAPAE